MNKRNLDGVYFRIKRNNKWEDICYSDLTIEEREMVGEGRTLEWWRSLANILADVIREIGDELDIKGVDKD